MRAGDVSTECETVDSYYENGLKHDQDVTVEVTVPKNGDADFNCDVEVLIAVANPGPPTVVVWVPLFTVEPGKSRKMAVTLEGKKKGYLSGGEIGYQCSFGLECNYTITVTPI